MDPDIESRRRHMSQFIRETCEACRTDAPKVLAEELRTLIAEIPD
jgi:hypothetical protein